MKIFCCGCYCVTGDWPYQTVTYPFQTPVHNMKFMHVRQTLHDIDKLGKWQVSLWDTRMTCQPTRSMRFASGFFLMNLRIVPLSVQSETNEHRSGLIVTPTNGTTFGCRRCLQMTASLQNFWSQVRKKSPIRSSMTIELTLSVNSGLPEGGCRETWTATGRPR